MIGVVVTGHGSFASGINGSIEVIAGKQENYYVVDFDGEHTEKLESDLKNCFENMKNFDRIFVFSDIAGGSPFKFACLLSQEYKNVSVIGGANVPLVVEVCLSRDYVDDIDSFINEKISNARDALMMF